MTTTLKDRVNECMEASGLKNAALAKICGVQPPTSFNWASGKTKNIKGAPLLKAAAAFGVTPEWLASGKGPKYPGQERQKAFTCEQPPAHYHTETTATTDPLVQEASSLLLKMSPAGREQCLAYLRFMATQHAVQPSSSGGERDSIPHQKAA